MRTYLVHFKYKIPRMTKKMRQIDRVSQLPENAINFAIYLVSQGLAAPEI